MEWITHIAAAIAGGVITALGTHWLRKNKPELYANLAGKAKQASDQIEEKAKE